MRFIKFLTLLACLLLVGCKPKTFVKSHEAVWASVELSDDLTYEQAWEKTVDTLTRNFDLEILDRDNGYIRTGWLYTWTGKRSEAYSVRITVNFKNNNRVVSFKPEAMYKNVTGYDTRLLQTIKTDIMGLLGRETR